MTPIQECPRVKCQASVVGLIDARDCGAAEVIKWLSDGRLGQVYDYSDCTLMIHLCAACSNHSDCPASVIL